MGSPAFSQFGVLGLYTETSLHCGSESALGYVDLPIQRERHTAYPLIPGSTLKGILRDECSALPTLDRRAVDRIFGVGTSPTQDGATASMDGRPGTVSFGDGILVAFPVRSSEAPFHWVTCPFALQRAFRLLHTRLPDLPLVEPGKALALQAGELLLEDILVERSAHPDLFARSGDSLTPALLALLPADDRGFGYIREIFPKRLVVLSDEEFKEMVEVGTDVVTRIKLNARGTTTTIERSDLEEHEEHWTDDERQGNLFVEELVPPEALFVAPLRAPDTPQDLLTGFAGMPIIRLGGDETIGRGVTHLVFQPADREEAPHA